MADLRYAGLSGAELVDTKLQAADLSHAKLVAELVRTLLSGAQLPRADLSRADIRANLGSADLSGANLEGAETVEANFGSANLRGADLRGATLISPLALTPTQIDSAKGNIATTLPNKLKMPESWKGQ